MNSTHCHPESKANATLTPAEKEAKKRLKAELKFQSKVKKLQKRINHAISRNDPVVEKSTREELAAFLSTRINKGDNDIDNGNINNDIDRLQQQHRELLCPSKNTQGKAAIDEANIIFRTLLSSMDDPNDKEKIRLDKIQQTNSAIRLLKNMTKGTQSKSMFRDVTTLRGYARQKFHERAALIIESLGKLSPALLEEVEAIISSSLALSSSSPVVNHVPSDMDSAMQQDFYGVQQKEVRSMCWEKLGTIEKICSLGCGPGNDAVGLMAFLRSYFDNHHHSNNNNNNNTDGVREILLLDYTINEWKDAILDDLVAILVPKYIHGITCEYCDVTNPLLNSSVEPLIQDSDIFLASYLLTETRNQWDEFFVQLVDLAKEGALFYFSEPVPWQLHRLIRMSSTTTKTTTSSSDVSPGVDCSPLCRLRFVWIDSSMHFPEIQKLDRRVGGPAVLLAIKI
mmetsp:Transcript_22381/g.48499  ORF Transcript_22381/g.48499 Transcript_22381/m.48499 type:complete len:454 (-) Transcript_22381:143-1504(-)